MEATSPSGATESAGATDRAADDTVAQVARVATEAAVEAWAVRTG